jgi:SPP1 gp7 family putative phage head morphogenesis protein
MPAPSKTQRAANLQDRERRYLERRASRDVRSISRQTVVEALRGIQSGSGVEQAIERGMGRFTALLVDAMTAGHLYGRLRSVRNAAAHIAGRRKGLAVDSMGPGYREAVQFVQARLDLTPEQIEQIRQQYGSTALDVTRRMGSHAERAAQQAIRESVEQGEHVRAAQSRLRQSMERLGIAPSQPHLWETLVATQIQLAYGAGRWNGQQDPAIQEILWGYQYVTVGDDRVRPNHMALENTKLPKDHPRWSEIWPPNGFRCRCALIEIFDEGTVVEPAPQVQIDGMTVRPGADQDWQFNPGLVYSDSIAA